jgi:hypothetical protein
MDSEEKAMKKRSDSVVLGVVLTVFAAVILAVLVLSILRYPIPTTVTVICYALTALFSAYILFGILRSWAWIKAQKGGDMIALGGAIAGTVVLIWMLAWLHDRLREDSPREPTVAASGMSQRASLTSDPNGKDLLEMPVLAPNAPPVAHLQLTKPDDPLASSGQRVGMEPAAADGVNGLVDNAPVSESPPLARFPRVPATKATTEALKKKSIPVDGQGKYLNIGR